MSELGVVYVITPALAMFSWEPHELYLRSLVVRAHDGLVISAGFPKFFDFGENKHSDGLTVASLANGATHLTKKMDGTLIIRAVVADSDFVYWRTRGAHQLGAFEEPVMALIRERHSKLLDPEYEREGFLLFEYTAPTNQIVVRYGEPKLWGLAKTYAIDIPKNGDPECLWAKPSHPRIHVAPFPSDVTREAGVEQVPTYGFSVNYRTTRDVEYSQFQSARRFREAAELILRLAEDPEMEDIDIIWVSA